MNNTICTFVCVLIHLCNPYITTDLPQTVLALEWDPTFGRDNQCNPNMTSTDVSYHLNKAREFRTMQNNIKEEKFKVKNLDQL